MKKFSLTIHKSLDERPCRFRSIIVPKGLQLRKLSDSYKGKD